MAKEKTAKILAGQRKVRERIQKQKNEQARVGRAIQEKKTGRRRTGAKVVGRII